MLTPQQAQDRAAALIDLARMAGADAADAVYAGGSAQAVSVRLGELEDIDRSESEHLDLRVFVGRSSASIGSSDLSDAALRELAERAVAMAGATPEDQYAGLAPEDRLHKGPLAELDIADDAQFTPQQLRDRALAQQRGRSVREALMAKGLASERLFIGEPKLRGEAAEGLEIALQFVTAGGDDGHMGMPLGGNRRRDINPTHNDATKDAVQGIGVAW